VTPELTDEVAKKNFGYDDVETLRNAVKEEIENDKKNSLPTLKEDRVVEAVGSTLILDEVSAEYQNEIFNELATEFLNRLQSQNISLDMFLNARGIKTDDFISDLHAQAEERARQSLALDAMARQLGLEATEEDVRDEFVKSGIQNVEEEIENWRNQGRLPAIHDSIKRIHDSIKRTKALDWLVENAKVTVVDEAAEAAAEPEADAAEPEATESADTTEE
jgi:trigger factor